MGRLRPGLAETKWSPKLCQIEIFIYLVSIIISYFIIY